MKMIGIMKFGNLEEKDSINFVDFFGSLVLKFSENLK